jgi:hypothetical protein
VLHRHSLELGEPDDLRDPTIVLFSSQKDPLDVAPARTKGLQHSVRTNQYILGHEFYCVTCQ